MRCYLKSEEYNIQAIKGLGYVSLLLAAVGIVVNLVVSNNQQHDYVGYIALLIVGSALNIISNELTELRK